ncbi:MAG: hypothetical protein A3G77_13695 [Acidobacteria bacterium RIFCSPLOWO2_12_FULL_68_19]|nr:MAG: hypothetical protein A3G77_13695 [Acidobacteria bacterium RIFCSPLOWO2_12_FULL_68_19]
MAGGVIAGLAAWVILGNETGVQPAPVTRFSIVLPDDERLPGAAGTLVAVSPDGEMLIYRSNTNGVFRLYRRTMGQTEAAIIGDENPGEVVFFSPDGQWLAFVVGTTLRKVPVSGGPSQIVAELPNAPRGGAWADDGTIVLGANAAGLLRIAASGGPPEPIAMAAPGRQIWYPQVLAGGRAILFTSTEPRPDSGELEILVLETGARRTLLAGSSGRVLPSGHLVFVRNGALWAVAFDLAALLVTGNPVAVVEGVRVEPGGATQMAVADSGTLVYLPGGSGTSLRRLAWVDRRGQNESGVYEVYVRPFPNVNGGRWQISSGGGTRPLWNRSGRELLYVTLPGVLMSVPAVPAN